MWGTMVSHADQHKSYWCVGFGIISSTWTHMNLHTDVLPWSTADLHLQKPVISSWTVHNQGRCISLTYTTSPIPDHYWADSTSKLRHPCDTAAAVLSGIFWRDDMIEKRHMQRHKLIPSCMAARPPMICRSSSNGMPVLVQFRPTNKWLYTYPSCVLLLRCVMYLNWSHKLK